MMADMPSLDVNVRLYARALLLRVMLVNPLSLNFEDSGIGRLKLSPPRVARHTER